MQDDLDLLSSEACLSSFSVIWQAVKMPFFFSITGSTEVHVLPWKNINQAFPIICGKISYNYGMHSIDRANKVVEVISLLPHEMHLINYIITITLPT